MWSQASSATRGQGCAAGHVTRLPDQRLVRLLTVMAHDIRGPIVSAMAGLHVVLHGSYGGMDAGVSRKLSNLHAHLARLLGTADELLARACCLEGAPCAGHEPLDLQEDVLEVVLGELAGELRDAQIQSRVEGLPSGTTVFASRWGMRAVFRNLLRNAVKYGNAGGAVVCGYQDGGGCHRLHVSNSGAPVPSELRPRLFTRFGSSPCAADPERTGVGLGLFLVREIVRAHGGEIRYEALPDGSDFVFTIPKDPSGRSDAAPVRPVGERSAAAGVRSLDSAGQRPNIVW